MGAIMNLLSPKPIEFAFDAFSAKFREITNHIRIKTKTVMFYFFYQCFGFGHI